MKKMMIVVAGVAATLAFVASAAPKPSDIPFCAIRLRKPQTDLAEVWKRTLAQFAKHRGAREPGGSPSPTKHSSKLPN